MPWLDWYNSLAKPSWTPAPANRGRQAEEDADPSCQPKSTVQCQMGRI